MPVCTGKHDGKKTIQRDLQQDAHQPAGNGTNDHAVWLSLAARGAFPKYQAEHISFSCGPDPTASLTISSNRSNSNSLMCVLRGLTGTVSRSFCRRIDLIGKIVAIGLRSQPWLPVSFILR
jgi:hypothetical protein